MTTLSDHLYAALERLNSSDIKPEDIPSEVQRANAVAKIGDTIINGLSLQLKVEIAKQEYEVVSSKELAEPLQRLGNTIIKGNLNEN